MRRKTRAVGANPTAATTATAEQAGRGRVSVACVLSEAVCLVLVVAVPAFINLSTERIFEEEKALLLRAAAALLVALAAVDVGRLRRTWRHPIALTLLLTAGVFAAAAALSLAPYESWMGAYYRRYGVATEAALVVVFLAMAGMAGRPASRERLLHALVLGSLWPSLYAIVQALGRDPLTWTNTIPGRAGSTGGNALLFAGYLAVVIPLTAFECARRTRRPPAMRIFCAVVLVCQIAALAATGSRGPALAIAAGVAVASLSRAATRWPRLTLTIAAATIAAAVIAAATTGWSSKLLEVGSGRVRVLIWDIAWQSMSESPPHRWLIGYGPETLRLLAPKYYAAEIGRIEGTEAMPDRAHNELLDRLVSSGAAGVAATLVLYATVLFYAVRIKEPYRRAGLVAAAFAHVVEVQLGIATVMSRLAFLCLAAAIVGHSMPDVDDGDARSSFRLWIAFAAGSALVPFVTLLDLPAAVPYGLVLACCAAVAWARLPRRRPRTEWVASAAAVTIAAAAAWFIAIVPSVADRFSRIGASLESRQDWDAAAAAYRAAAELQPREPYYWTALGRTLLEQAREAPTAARPALFEASGRALDAAAQRNPYDPYAPRNLASLARRRAAQTDEPAARERLLADADRQYARATTLAPRLPALWVEWANVAAEQERLDAALARLDRAEELNRDDPELWTLRGTIQARMRRLDAALAAYERALGIDGRAVAALRGRAVVLTTLGRRDEARQSVERLLAMEPADPLGLRMRAALAVPSR